MGSLSRAASFSFYANKIITTGEGGMVTTSDGELARLARRLRDHAFSDERHFWHKYVGFNYRMTNLQAAVGLAQTERLEEFIAIRRANAARYTGRLSRIPGLTLPVESLRTLRDAVIASVPRDGDRFRARAQLLEPPPVLLTDRADAVQRGIRRVCPAARRPAQPRALR